MNFPKISKLELFITATFLLTACDRNSNEGQTGDQPSTTKNPATESKPGDSLDAEDENQKNNQWKTVYLDFLKTLNTIIEESPEPSGNPAGRLNDDAGNIIWKLFSYDDEKAAGGIIVKKFNGTTVEWEMIVEKISETDGVTTVFLETNSDNVWNVRADLKTPKDAESLSPGKKVRVRGELQYEGNPFEFIVVAWGAGVNEGKVNYAIGLKSAKVELLPEK